MRAAKRSENRIVNGRVGLRLAGASTLAFALAGVGLAVPAMASSSSSPSPDTAASAGPAAAASTAGPSTTDAAAGGCTAGAHTLGAPGDDLYADTGNGGYTSVHTDVTMVYDATTNLFLPGNNVALTDQATQCLSSFSLDFERTSADTVAGPDMTVNSVTVNGQPATFTFVQPTLPR